MTNTVRKQKSGDQLTPGDWLAPGELLIVGAGEVLYALAYPASADSSRDNDGKHVHLVVRGQGTTVPYSDIVSGNTLFSLASDEDLAGLREAAERTQKIAEIRALATWLEERPWLPIPGLHCNDHLYGLDGYRKVVELAGRPGGKLDTRLDDRTVVKFDEGPLSYSVIAWHDKGRPGEPAPEPVDPTGLAYTRADDGPDDPTPVSPARVPMHTGAVTDGGLVDETPVAEHYETSGWTGGDSGSGVACACGTTFDGFDSIAEAGKQLRRHIADERIALAAVPAPAAEVEVAAPTIDAELVSVRPGPARDADRCPACGHWQTGFWSGQHSPDGCGATSGSGRCGCTYSDAA